MSKERDNIRKLVQALGSQRAVAQKLGVNQSTISRILNKKISKTNKKISSKASKVLSYQRNNYAFNVRVKMRIKNKAGEESIMWASTIYREVDDVTGDSLDDEIDKLVAKIENSDISVEEILQVKIEKRPFKIKKIKK